MPLAITVVPEVVDTESETPEYTIDELAAATGVPSRTIRFYQSAGALQKPEIRGRIAIYTRAHAERLKLIGRLQDRGLRMRAIRDLTQKVDSGELQLGEWLGLEERINESWADEEPRMLSESELQELLGERRAGLVADLVRFGLLERKGKSYLVGSPLFLRAALDLQDSGVDVEVMANGLTAMRKHMARLADELVALYVSRIGDGFGGSGDAPEVSASLASARPVGLEVARAVFGEEMQRALRGAELIGKVGKKKKKS